MPKFNSKEFKKLKDHWYQKLEKSGFEDIEDHHNRLIKPNQRTIAFENREQILNFFLDLDEFLITEKNLNPRHRAILELYTRGTFLKEISRKVGRSYADVKATIRIYKRIILNK